MLDNTSKLWKSIKVKYFFIFFKILTSKMSIYLLLDFFFFSQKLFRASHGYTTSLTDFALVKMLNNLFSFLTSSFFLKYQN